MKSRKEKKGEEAEARAKIGRDLDLVGAQWRASEKRGTARMGNIGRGTETGEETQAETDARNEDEVEKFTIAVKTDTEI